jgi:chromosome segregation ATPase
MSEMGSDDSAETEALRVQLIQVQRDKMTLLDQLAMVKVTVCFSCMRDLPTMEVNLQQTLDRRTTRLNKLRENVVRVSDSLHTEQHHLQQMERQLLQMKRESVKLNRMLQHEQGEAGDLKKSLDAHKKEKEAFATKRELEKQRLVDLKMEVGMFQAQTHELEVVGEINGSKVSIELLEAELKDLNETRDSLDTEVCTIKEYIRLKSVELRNAKNQLDEIKGAEGGVEQTRTEKLQSRESLKNELNAAQDEIKSLKKRLQKIKEEKECVESATAEERKALEDAKQRELLTQEDTLYMQLTLGKVVEENELAKRRLLEVELELKRVIDKQARLNSELVAAKTELEDSQRLLQYCKDHQKESQETYRGIKCRMLSEFSESRKKLRELQEERLRLNKELSKASGVAGKNHDLEYSVKEICDTLIGGLTRVAPEKDLSSIVDHIQSEFAEYLKKHSISDEKAHKDHFEKNKITEKLELIKENSELENELSELQKRNKELRDLREKEENQMHQELQSDLAQLPDELPAQEQPQNQEEAAAADDNSRSSSNASLQELFQSAMQCKKDPYPNMRK